MIFCKALSLARRSATASTAPQRLSVPARTLSPTSFSTAVPPPAQIATNLPANRPRAGLHEIAGQPEGAAQNRRQQLRFPFVGPLHVFEELDIPLYHLGPRNVAPPPELRRRRAGDPGDGGGI